MCKQFHWKRDKDDPSSEGEAAYQLLRDAMTKQFNEIYGTDADSLHAWQNLCHVLDISPIPENLKECRETVMNTHVNLVDLTERKGQHVTKFSSETELSEYTQEEEKYFPKKNAHAGGLLKYLLRQILNPSSSNRRGVSYRGGHGGRRNRWR
jgi:hypothetical protein